MLAGQTIVYYVLAALERGATQAHYARTMLKREGHDFTSRQISGALQRLSKEGLAEYSRCMWQLKARNA
jgi:hypothetical protein